MPKNKNVVAVEGTAVQGKGTFIIPLLYDNTLCVKFAESPESKWGKTLGYSTLQRVLDNADAIKRIMTNVDANVIKSQAAIPASKELAQANSMTGELSNSQVADYLQNVKGMSAAQALEFCILAQARQMASEYYAEQSKNVALTAEQKFAQALENGAHVSATPSINHPAKKDKRELATVKNDVATQANQSDVYGAFVRKYPVGSDKEKITQADWHALTDAERKAYTHAIGLYFDAKFASNDKATVKDATPKEDKPKIGIQYSVKIRDAAGNANENVLTAPTKRDAVIALDGKKLVTSMLLNGKPAKADYIVATSAQDANANHKYAQMVRDGYIVEL